MKRWIGLLLLVTVGMVSFSAVSLPREETVYIPGCLWGPGVGWETYIESVKAIDSKTVEFKARKDNLNYFQFVNYAFTTQPVPKEIYSKQSC